MTKDSISNYRTKKLKVTKMHPVQSIGYAAAYPAYPLNPPLQYDRLFLFCRLSFIYCISFSLLAIRLPSFNKLELSWVESVCPSVTLCILALRVGIGGWKLYRRVPSKQLPIHFFRHLCYRHRTYRLVSKQRSAKKVIHIKSRLQFETVSK